MRNWASFDVFFFVFPNVTETRLQSLPKFSLIAQTACRSLVVANRCEIVPQGGAVTSSIFHRLGRLLRAHGPTRDLSFRRFAAPPAPAPLRGIVPSCVGSLQYLSHLPATARTPRVAPSSLIRRRSLSAVPLFTSPILFFGTPQLVAQ